MRGITADPFRMQSLQEVVKLMQVGDWMFSFDLNRDTFKSHLR
jgi:hypothetical protein